MVVRDAGRDAAVLQGYFGPQLSSAVIEQALAYAAEHREVDAWVGENDRLGEEMERAYLARSRAWLVRLLLDEDVDRRLAAALVARGIDVVHAADAGLAGASDVAVFDWAMLRHDDVGGIASGIERFVRGARALAPGTVGIRVRGGALSRPARRC
jgi:post-segregation antitoxin (ccd killing protein)